MRVSSTCNTLTAHTLGMTAEVYFIVSGQCISCGIDPLNITKLGVNQADTS